MSFILEGIASGSKNNCFWVKQWDILLDIGTHFKNIISIRNVLLTHAHTDHSAGLIYYLSQRELFDFPPCRIYTPPSTVEKFQKAIRAWEELEEITYKYQVFPAEVNTRHILDRNHYFQAYPVHHRIASTGYTIFEHKKKLKKEYLYLSSSEIQNLENKEKITEEITWPVLSYLGDCDFDSFVCNKDFQRSQVLILESTFIDHWKNIDHAKLWGHIHLNQIFGNPEFFQENQKIILTHFSSRYTPQYVERIVKSQCPNSLKEKIIIWPNLQKLELPMNKIDF